MQEMDRRVGLLRLLLADISAREQDLRASLAQAEAQLHRAADYTVRFNGSVANGLALLGEVEDRLAQHERQLRHLGLLRERAQSELDALVVTRGVEDAHARLEQLERRHHTLTGEDVAGGDTAPGELLAIEAEMAELRSAIASASDAAARALRSRTERA